MPVRGQIVWLIRQPEVDYGVANNGVFVLPRRDRICVQATEGSDRKGFNDANETVDRAELVKAVETIAELYSRFPAAWQVSVSHVR